MSAGLPGVWLRSLIDCALFTAAYSHGLRISAFRPRLQRLIVARAATRASARCFLAAAPHFVLSWCSLVCVPKVGPESLEQRGGRVEVSRGQNGVATHVEEGGASPHQNLRCAGGGGGSMIETGEPAGACGRVHASEGARGAEQG